jgi:phage terminase small subunit
MARKRLTQRQETFCLKYFELGNGTEAAIQAGYSRRSIRNIASVNLTKANIQARLQELRQKAEDASIMSVKERQQRLTEIARAKLTDFMELGQDGSWVNLGPETSLSGAIQEIHSRTEYDKDGSQPTVYTSVKIHDPMKAIDLLNKMDKIYSEQPVGNTWNIGAMQVNVGDPKEKLLSELARLAARAGEGENNTEPAR